MVETLNAQRDNEQKLDARFTTVREIITKALLDNSVSRSLSPVAKGFKLRCAESIQSVLLDSDSTNDSQIPLTLKKSLQQKDFKFLVFWLEVFDEMRQKWTVDHKKRMDKISNLLVQLDTATTIAKQMIHELIQHSENEM